MERGFNTFAVGPSNNEAVAAAALVAAQSEFAANPLVIHGPSGCGKSHLLRAIASHIRLHHLAATVAEATAWEFVEELVEALRSSNATRFKDRWLGSDIVLLDQAESLRGRTALQEELAHTALEICRRGGQVVICSVNGLPVFDRIVRHGPHVRFVGVRAPDRATRVALLRREALRHGDLPREVVEALTANRVASIGQLQGHLVCLRARQDIDGLPPSKAMVEQLTGVS